MTLSQAIRNSIVTLHQSGKNVGAIVKLLSSHKISRQTVWNTLKLYRETGSTLPRKGKGRPRSARTPDLREKLRKAVKRNPVRSMRGLAKDYRVSENTVRRVVHTDLGLKSLRKQQSQYLSDENKKNRRERCKAFITKAAQFGWGRILWSDEKRFVVSAKHNRQNVRVLSKNVSAIPSAHRRVLRSQKPSAVSVWAGAWAGGRTNLVFFPSGDRLNATKYQDEVLEVILTNGGRDLMGNQPFLFTQDGAPAHTANSTQHWLRSRNIAFADKSEWPPVSPDCNPMDFALWSQLEAKACATPSHNVEELKRKLSSAWSKIPAEDVRRSCLAAEQRFKACVKAKGDHFER